MPMPQMKTVQSTKVFQMGYDEKEQTLYVRYTPSKKYPGGRVAVYQGVPPLTAEEIASAPSVGQALASSVEGIYPHTYVG
jgi:hypothetical protein